MGTWFAASTGRVPCGAGVGSSNSARSARRARTCSRKVASSSAATASRASSSGCMQLIVVPRFWLPAPQDAARIVTDTPPVRTRIRQAGWPKDRRHARVLGRKCWPIIPTRQSGNFRCWNGFCHGFLWFCYGILHVGQRSGQRAGYGSLTANWARFGKFIRPHSKGQPRGAWSFFFVHEMRVESQGRTPIPCLAPLGWAAELMMN